MTTPLTPAQLAKLAKLLPELVEYNNTVCPPVELWHKVTSCPVKPSEYDYLCRMAEAKIESVDKVLERRAYVSRLMEIVGVSPDMNGKWSFVQDFALLHATPAQRIDALPEPE